MARARRQNGDQLSLLEARVGTAPLVTGIRGKVKAWREDRYKGISDTTRILLTIGSTPIIGCRMAAGLPIIIFSGKLSRR